MPWKCKSFLPLDQFVWFLRSEMCDRKLYDRCSSHYIYMVNIRAAVSSPCGDSFHCAFNLFLFNNASGEFFSVFSYSYDRSSNWAYFSVLNKRISSSACISDWFPDEKLAFSCHHLLSRQKILMFWCLKQRSNKYGLHTFIYLTVLQKVIVIDW